jgi:uncharacterized protein (DUF1501 family)
MSKSKLSRRAFLTGSCATASGFLGSRLTSLSITPPLAPEDEDHEILVVVFIRGGWDALNVLSPLSGDDRIYYETARPDLKVPTEGAEASLPLDGQFGLHPAMTPIYDLYQDGNLAFIHAAGLTSNTRSHFDAMLYMELGTPDQKNSSTGWLTRHIETAPGFPSSILFPTLAAGYGQPTSLLGSPDAVTMSDPDDFDLLGHWYLTDFQKVALRQMYDGDHWLFEAGTRSLNAMDIVDNLSGNYIPANGAVYPEGEFGEQLTTIAQMIKEEVGLRTATIDIGGWDTHENQGSGSGGYLADQLDLLARGLLALYTDLNGTGSEDYASRLTLVGMSEFGRRFKQNANLGTDHGHGGVMFVLGGSVNGNQVFGQWPGLRNDQLYDRADLAITTDYRRILSEILIRRFANPYLGIIFPEYEDYEPIGVVSGDDIPPIYDSGYSVYLPLALQ